MSTWSQMQAKAADWVARASAALGVAPGADPSAPPGTAGQWAPNTKYAQGVQVTSAGYSLVAVQGGVSGQTPPSIASGATVIDGTVVWMIATGASGAWAPNTQYSVGALVTSLGSQYRAVIAGVSGTVAPNDQSGNAVRDGSVVWVYNGADPGAAVAPPDGGGYGGGGGGGGGSDEGGGGGDAEGGSEGGGEFEDDSGTSPVDEDLVPASEPIEDPFSDENETDPSDQDVLGIGPEGYGFKWQYIFAPWEAVQDYTKEGPGSAHGPMTSDAKPAPAVKVTPAQLAKLATAQRRYAAAVASRQQASSSQASSPEYVAPTSPAFAERLAQTRAFLGTPGQPAPITEGEAVEGDDNFVRPSDNDILMDNWGTDITDEPADPFRRTASLHHGAGYLQSHSLPRYGSSAGQEGGLMYPRETIHVFGSGDGSDAYDRGADVLGAGVPPSTKPKPRLQFVAKATPAGNRHVSMVANKPRTGKHKTSIKNARDVAKRAISVGTKVFSAASKAPAKSTAVHGDDDVLGVVARAAHRKLGHAQIKVIADKAVKAGKDLNAHADKHAKQFDAATKREKAGAAVARKMPANKGTVIHGDADERDYLMYGALEDVLGDEILGAAAGDALSDEMFGDTVTYSPPQPVGTPDAPPPNPGYGAAGDQPATDSAPAIDAGDPNAGQGPMPTIDTLPPYNFTPGPSAKTDSTAYTQLPEGAIVFDGSKPMTTNCIGSFNLEMNGGNGVVWQGDSGKGHWNGRWGGWYGVLDDWSNGEGTTEGSKAGAAWWKGKGKAPRPDSSFADVNGASLASGWGPIVGSPNDAVWKNLRYDAGGDQWFWFYDQAPQWAKDPGEQLRLTQAITDWKTAVTAAKTDAATQAAQDLLDADQAKATAKQQAAEDATTSHQIDQENVLAQHDADLQAKADEAAARQQELADASQARQQSAQMDADIKAQQAQAEIDRAQQQQDFEQYQAIAPQAADADGSEETGEEVPTDTGEFNLEENAPSEIEAATEVTGSARLRAHTIRGKRA